MSTIHASRRRPGSSSCRYACGGAIRAGVTLDDRRQRALVYEQVLQEGTDEDVRHFIDVDALIDLWDELYLPDHVRQRWAEWLGEHRGVHLPC